MNKSAHFLVVFSMKIQDGANVHGIPSASNTKYNNNLILIHSLFCITSFALFVTWLIRDSTSALIYDRYTLLNIRSSFEKFVTEERVDLKFSETASHLNIPTWLQRESFAPLTEETASPRKARW